MTKAADTIAPVRRIEVDRDKLVGIDTLAVAVGSKPVAVGFKPPVDPR